MSKAFHYERRYTVKDMRLWKALHQKGDVSNCVFLYQKKVTSNHFPVKVNWSFTQKGVTYKKDYLEKGTK